MSRRPRRRRRRRPSPAEEPAAPAGREHRLPTLSARPRPHSGLGGRVPRRPPLPSPVRWAPGGPAPLGRWRAAAGARAPSSSPRRLRFSFEHPSPRPESGCPGSGPRAVRGGDEATRLASGLEARGADVCRSESVPGERSSFLKHTRAANKLCFPPCSTQATFGWKTGHLTMTARPSSGEDGMHTLGAAVGRKVL